MDLGDCDVCNAVILVVIFILTGIFAMWNQSQKTAALEKQPESTSTAEPKKASKSKSKTKSKENKEKKEKSNKPATKDADENATSQVTTTTTAQVQLSDDESEVEAPKKKSKKNKKNKKGAAATKTGDEDKSADVVQTQKADKEEKAAPAAEKKNSKKAKEVKPKVAKLPAAKKEQDSWIDVESPSTPNHTEPTPKQPAPAQKVTTKKQPQKPVKSADDYLKDLPEEIRERIKQQNSKESQLAKTAKSGSGSFSNDDWIVTKDENMNNGNANNEIGGAGDKAKFAKAQETITEIDSVAMKVAEVKKVYCKANIWNKTHENKLVEEKKVISKVQLAGNILDYTW